MFLVLYAYSDGALVFEAYAFGAVYLSLSVSVGETEDFYYVSSADLHLLL